jgi:hypothetical protein
MRNQLRKAVTAGLAALAMVGSGASSVGANCTGSTLWAYDAGGHRLVTVSLDGNATVQQVVALDAGVPPLEGLAWTPDGSELWGLFADGGIAEIDPATGLAVPLPPGTIGNFDFTTNGARPNETVRSFTMRADAGPNTWFVSAVNDPDAQPQPELWLREMNATNFTDFTTPLFGSTPVTIGGMDAASCNYDGFLGVARGDVGLIRVFHWYEFSPGVWASGQIDPFSMPGDSVDAMAVEGSQIYTIGKTTGNLVRFVPTANTFQTVTPQYLGTIGAGYDIRGMSFGPAAGGGNGTTTTTSTTTSSTSTTTLMPMVQSPAQTACIVGVNKAAAKLAKARAKHSEKCLKDRHDGKLAGSSFPDMPLCLGADRKGKVTKAQAKLAGAELNLCSGAGAPDFGYLAQMADFSHELAPRNLAEDLFGIDTETAGAAGATGAAVGKCQRTALGAAHKLLDARLGEFGKCKKKDLADGIIQTPGGLATCLTLLADTNSSYGAKVTKSAASMASRLSKACTGVASATALPGRCGGLSGTALEACVDAATACQSCLALSVGDDFAMDCDLYDDAAINSSCGY